MTTTHTTTETKAYATKRTASRANHVKSGEARVRCNVGHSGNHRLTYERGLQRAAPPAPQKNTSKDVMKHYYAVDSIGISANTNRRFCAKYVRFTTAAERDEWVSNGKNRTAIPSNDRDLKHEVKAAGVGWMDDVNSSGEWLV